MFFWLIAIPFFVIIAMFTLFRLPSSDLNQPEEIQDAAMAFRMALQHDAAAKLMEDYKADGESTFFDLGSYNIEGDDWKATLMESGYLPASFVSDTDNIVTYVRCLNSLREITSCRTATGVYIVTAAAAPSSSAITSRWFETAGAERLAEQLEKYSGSFPVKQDGLAIPVRPVKEEDESDEDFAIRLNAYKTAKSEYMRLKRRYYNFGEGMPRPDTTVGQVRAYPFDGGEEADERVIVRRIRSVEGGTVNYDLTQVPVDIPDTEGQVFDFNGEAVILTASFKQPDSCVTVYEAKNISTSTLSSAVQEIGTYTIPVAGNYQIKLMGEAGYWVNHGDYTTIDNGAGGILIANTYYDADTFLTLKGIRGFWSASYWAGAGIALWDTISTVGAPKLVSGGGGIASGGGGYNGGASTYPVTTSGYSWDDSLGSNTAYCSSTSCNIGATGGRSYWAGGGFGYTYGGTGTGSSGYPCPNGYTCATIAGGNDTSYPENYPASTYGNWGTNTLTGGKGYASIAYCGPDAESFCSTYPCDTTKTCLIANDCPSNKPYCNNGECSATQILTCGSTSTMATDTWIAGWANCTTCPPGQFKKYQSAGETSQCAYPVTSTAGCVNIPAVNSYTTMPKAVYAVSSSPWETVSNANMWHRQVNITCNGKNEEWDLVGPFINWWEAQEICAKLGKTLPANTSVLTGGCTEGARWSLIKNATAVGTGQTLTAVSGITTFASWNRSTGNVNESWHYSFTNQDYGNSCGVFDVPLATGDTSRDSRSIASADAYTLCGPAN